MTVRLVFLGRLEDAAGAAERLVTVTGSLSAIMAALDPELAETLSAERIKLALNGAMVNDRTGLVLKDGDELAFLPPVSGG
ncbi:MAG: MoaD/ThiS family protein [Novosphingobium sp.]